MVSAVNRFWRRKKHAVVFFINTALVALLVLLAIISPGEGKELDRQPLPSGASLIFRETLVNGEGGYELVYAPPNAGERSIWSFPNQQGMLNLMPIVSAYEGDGKVSALFYHGASAKDILLIRATTTPPSPAPATISIVGPVDSHGNPTIGQAKLIDHDHIDLTKPDGTVNHLTIDPVTYMAKKDGVPVQTNLLKGDSAIGANPQINGNDFFEGKLDAALRAIGERARDKEPKPDALGSPNAAPMNAGTGGSNTPSAGNVDTKSVEALKSGPQASPQLTESKAAASASSSTIESQRPAWFWIAVGALLLALGATFFIKRAKSLSLNSSCTLGRGR